MACWRGDDWADAEIVDGKCACCGAVVVCSCSPDCDGE